MTNDLPSMPTVRIGQIKTFGNGGPTYQVTGNSHPSKDGEWLVPIRVIESGEELEYRYSRFTQNPEAQ